MTVIWNILSDSWNILGEMSIYLLFGFFVAGVLSVLIKPETVERHLGKKGFWSVVKASLFGVPLPLCSCGVIPVASSLRKHGATRGATTSFLLSTPQTGVDSILVTYSLLGGVLAIFRPVVAFLTGIIGGLAVNVFGQKEDDGDGRPNCQDECCASVGEGKRNRILQAFHFGFVDLPKDIGKDLLIGLIAAGVISAIVPDDYFASVLGGGIVSMLVMMGLGIPVYVCASASVPIALSLIEKGVSPGAAMVFLITGPASNAASIITIRKIMGMRTAVIYLLTVAITALASGFILDGIITSKDIPLVVEHVHEHSMFPAMVKTISSFVLIGILIIPMISAVASGSRKIALDRGEAEVILTIMGLSCEACVRNVRKAILAVPGVTSVEIDRNSGVAKCYGTGINRNEVEQAIKACGYGLREENNLHKLTVF